MLIVGNDHKTVRRRVTIWEVGDNAVILGKTLIGDYNDPSNTYGQSAMQYPAILEHDGDLWLASSRQPSSVATAGIGIQIDAIRWVKPIPREAGGTGVRNRLPNLESETIPRGTMIAYSTTPTCNLLYTGPFYITLTASTATLQPPTHMLPWQELTLIMQQGGSGSYTMAFDAIFEFNGITPAWETAVGKANVMKAIYNELTNKWVVFSFN